MYDRWGVPIAPPAHASPPPGPVVPLETLQYLARPVRAQHAERPYQPERLRTDWLLFYGLCLLVLLGFILTVYLVKQVGSLQQQVSLLSLRLALAKRTVQ